MTGQLVPSTCPACLYDSSFLCQAQDLGVEVLHTAGQLSRTPHACMHARLSTCSLVTSMHKTIITSHGYDCRQTVETGQIDGLRYFTLVLKNTHIGFHHLYTRSS